MCVRVYARVSVCADLLADVAVAPVVALCQLGCSIRTSLIGFMADGITVRFNDISQNGKDFHWVCSLA